MFFRASQTSHYFFVLQWPDRQHDDPYGSYLPSHAAALEYAHRIIRELKEAPGYDDPNLKMIVKNADGDVLYLIPF